MSDYRPDNWVVLKITYSEETLYKVLGGWSGGYLDGDSWRMNSGINLAFEHKEHIDFYGHSGSCYHCHRKSYGLRMNNAGVYNQIKERFGDKVELMPEDTNWMEIEW